MCGRILATPLSFWILAKNALVMLSITRVYSEDYSMDVFQYIICCIIASILPPFTWIYVLIDWILDGCRIPSFTLEDIAICECSDDDMDFEDFVVLQQMLDDFRLNAKSII